MCKGCHDKILDVRTPFAAKMINTLDSDSLMLSQAVGVVNAMNGDVVESAEGGGLNGNGSSSNSLNISRSIETNGNRFV